MQTCKPARTLAALAAAALLAHAPAFADAPPRNLDEVTLVGWLHVVDHDFALTTVEAEVNGTVLVAPVSRTGRFTLALPVNTEAVIRFDHPGHVAKEVKVDTHFAQDGEAGQHPRTIHMAVVLEQERHLAGYTYAGPVGSIGFEKGGGCVVVEKTRRMVPARRGKAIEF
jgi:hypothetical protein